jgi:hypothetical protein
LSVPAVGEDVIMIQWATGPNVARWTTALAQIAIEPLFDVEIRHDLPNR